MADDLRFIFQLVEGDGAAGATPRDGKPPKRSEAEGGRTGADALRGRQREGDTHRMRKDSTRRGGPLDRLADQAGLDLAKSGRAAREILAPLRGVPGAGAALGAMGRLAPILTAAGPVAAVAGIGAAIVGTGVAGMRAAVGASRELAALDPALAAATARAEAARVQRDIADARRLSPVFQDLPEQIGQFTGEMRTLTRNFGAFFAPITRDVAGVGAGVGMGLNAILGPAAEVNLGEAITRRIPGLSEIHAIADVLRFFGIIGEGARSGDDLFTFLLNQDHIMPQFALAPETILGPAAGPFTYENRPAGLPLP